MTRNREYQLIVGDDGYVEFYGIELGGHPRLHSISRDGTIVVKVASHRRWGGIGQTLSEPAVLLVFDIIERPSPLKPNNGRLIVREIARVPVRGDDPARLAAEALSS